MTNPGPPIARRIDHVIVEAADEARLFAFFTETLDLPVAWPVAQWGRYREGGVSLGNANVGCNHFRDPDSDPTPTVRRVALEPAAPIDEVVAELESRGRLLPPPIVSGRIDLPAVAPYTPWIDGWTVLQLRTGLVPTPFVCAYDHDNAARVEAQRAELGATGGGRIGVTDLRALVIATDDLPGATEEWASYLAPGVGPELRLIEGATPPALVLGVRSLTSAIEALDALDIGHSPSGAEIRLDPATALGLELRLTEA